MDSCTLGCLVMASGHGKRFGSNKLLAPFGGTALLNATLSRIPTQLFQKNIVVTQTPMCCSIAKQWGFAPILHTLPYRSDALRLGIEQMEGLDGCLVVQADQPLCLPQSYARLWAAFQANPVGFFRLSWQGTAASPTVFPAHSFGALCRLHHTAGGSAILPKNSLLVTLVPAKYPWELQDIDTPADLEALLPFADYTEEASPLLL